MEIDVRIARSDDWQVVREIRLESLLDAPSAFGSTHARELRLPEAEWRRRIGNGATFLAWAGERAAGTATGVPSSAGADVAELVGMWVHPSVRGRGVGEALVASVAGWARERGTRRLRLWVADANGPARRLYERCGFVLTGEREPMPRDPGTWQLAMDRALDRVDR